MTELAVLSSDLTTITAEIHTYKRIAGEAIFEIGRRLKHVKENDLTRGKWSCWCSDTLGMDRKTADKFIVVFEELGGNDSTSSQVGISALYEIATLPPEERTRGHTLKSGETKQPDEMTVRELREVKAALKAEREAREEAEQLRQEAEAERDRAYDDYETVRDTLDSMSTTYVDDGTYRIDNQTEVNGAALSFSDDVRDFLKKYAYITNYCTEMVTANSASRAEYQSAIDGLQEFVSGFRRNLEYVTADSAVIIDVN